MPLLSEQGKLYGGSKTTVVGATWWLVFALSAGAAVNNTDDFFLFFLGNTHAFQSLSDSAVRTDQRFVVGSGKCRNTGVGFSAKWADCRNWLIRFHGGTPPVR